MRLNCKINDLVTGDFDNYASVIEQIKKKGNRIAQMDEKLATLINNTTEIESAMQDVEEFQYDIVDKIATATRYEELSLSVRDHQTHHVLTHSRISINYSQKVHVLIKYNGILVSTTYNNTQ